MLQALVWKRHITSFVANVLREFLRRYLPPSDKSGQATRVGSLGALWMWACFCFWATERESPREAASPRKTGSFSPWSQSRVRRWTLWSLSPSWQQASCALLPPLSTSWTGVRATLSSLWSASQLTHLPSCIPITKCTQKLLAIVQTNSTWSTTADWEIFTIKNVFASCLGGEN